MLRKSSLLAAMAVLTLSAGAGAFAQEGDNLPRPRRVQPQAGPIQPDSIEKIEPWEWREVEIPEKVKVPQPVTRRAPGVPESLEDYLARKERARFNPRVPKADAPASLEEKSSLDVISEAVVAGTSFQGLNFGSSANNANPPDTTLGKSPLRVLEGVNRAVRLFNDDGTIRGTSDLNAFYGAATTDGLLFDPKVIFDRNAVNKRFYVVSLQKDVATQLSKIWLAVSRSENPNTLSATDWCFYSINGVRNAGTADASWADYPGLGVGADAVVISANQFRFSNQNYLTYAIVRVLNKSIANNAASCPSPTLYTFQPSAAANNFSVFTLQPVQHYASPSSFAGTTNPAYLLSNRYGSGSTYTVWRVRNVASGAPTLDSTSVTVTSYSTPPNAPQLGSAITLETKDSRFTQAAAWGDGLWGVHATACQNGAGANESCVVATRIGVGQAAGGGVTASLFSLNTVGGGDDVFYWWGGIAVNSSEQTALAFQQSSTTSYLSAAWSFKDLIMPFYPAATTFTSGTCALPAAVPGGTFARTGDYVGAHLEPSAAARLWVAGESATTIGASCAWTTRIQEIIP